MLKGLATTGDCRREVDCGGEGDAAAAKAVVRDTAGANDGWGGGTVDPDPLDSNILIRSLALEGDA